MKCEGNVCLRHQYRCEDRSCKSYLICSNCQHQARHSLWRTIEPKTMWVCQACALKADYSYDFFCELCERHHRRLYTCQNCERRVCSKDNFWCAQKSCSHHLCRDCNGNSSNDIEKFGGRWSCAKCRGSEESMADKKSRDSHGSKELESKRRRYR